MVALKVLKRSYTRKQPSMAVIGVFIFIMLVAVWYLYRSEKEHNSESLWQIPSVGNSSRDQFFYYKWDPRFKIMSCLILSFVTVSLKSFIFIGLSCLWTSVFLAISRIPWSGLKRRLKPVLAFSTLLVILMPLTAPKNYATVIIAVSFLNDLKLNYSALREALNIAFKAFSMVFVATFMLESAPYTVTIQALQKLGLPKSIGQMLLISYRYIFVLKEEALKMNRAMHLRGFNRRLSLENFKILGNFLGTLFVRSFEKMQRIQEAMTLRGYKGTFPYFVQFKASKKDWILFMLWSLFAFLILGLDKFYP